MLPARARRIARHTDRGMSSAMDRAKLTSLRGVESATSLMGFATPECGRAVA
jgi:hypothetical protein